MDREYIDSGLIEPKELSPLLDHPNVKLVDASYVLPGQADNRLARFGESRIGTAVFFDIDAIADHNTDLPHMLPTEDEFARAVSELGITNDDTVVVYGQSGIIMGPARVWWTFRVFGHDKVCVLNGGLPAWTAEGYEMNDTLYTPPEPAQFEAAFQPELVSHLAAVQNASAGGTALILDARSPGRFEGVEPEPRPGLAMGHIPGSQNIPAGWLVNEKTGKLKSRAEIQAVFESFSLSDESSPITSCGSGVTAAMIALALFHIGIKTASIYDGSWAEWGAKSLPIEIKNS